MCGAARQRLVCVGKQNWYNFPWRTARTAGQEGNNRRKDVFMAVRPILQIENPEEKKVLKSRSHPVKLPNQGLRQLIADMVETMHAANGVGLAAPQVGVAYRLAVIYIPPE